MLAHALGLLATDNVYTQLRGNRTKFASSRTRTCVPTAIVACGCRHCLVQA